MKKPSLFLCFFFIVSVAQAQYFPPGTAMNNNTWPNVEEPIMWFIHFDGMYDFQREKLAGFDVSS